MAYVTTNPPIALTQGPLVGSGRSEAGNSGGKIWLYNSADAVATVAGANYFSNGSALGMQQNDVVIVMDTTNNRMSIGFITSVTAGGAASLNTGTTLTAT